MAFLDTLTFCAGARICPGVSLDSDGADFALYSESARAVSVVLFDDKGASRSFALTRKGNLWVGRVCGALAGLRYGYRVQTEPDPGNKPTENLLLDPYAPDITGCYARDAAEGACGLYGVLPVPDTFDWEDDRPPATPISESVFYEVHVKGATKLLFDIPERIRGTYEGLASAPFVKHLKALGVTAVDILPVAYALDEDRLKARGLRNYWGYNPISFFALQHRYAADPAHVRDEFRRTVKALHKAGLEVILDVVYNHTAETDETGPTLGFRGIDNKTYYKVRGDNPDLYVNDTGCGNTVNVAHPAVLELILESLRTWVRTMHVDGFRFDLAAALTRESRFLEAVRSDPVLRNVKLIAEPWDIGPDGYRLGRFGVPWSEWNDRFRDDVRAFWVTKSAPIGALAQRLCASSEVFRRDERAPQASVNFITAHDGFTLSDLVSYNGKHNEANGEDNRDGTDRNLSFNCGVEGATRDEAVLLRRRLLRRALLAALLLSQGVPMLLAGDEFAHSQGGNNNAYCQDNPTTWLSWYEKEADDDTAFIGTLCRIRRAFGQFENTSWLTGLVKEGERDITWLTPDARQMRSADWTDRADTLGFLLARKELTGRVLVYVYRQEGEKTLKLPLGDWTCILKTEEDKPDRPFECGETLTVTGPGVAVLCEKCEHLPRRSGLIMHVTSLAGPFGSGDFGKGARDFIDWMKRGNQKLWQVLPLTVTGEGNSPYMGESVFAGNELLIDLATLVRERLLLPSELAVKEPFDEEKVDFARVTDFRLDRLKRAAFRFFSQKTLPEAFGKFVWQERYWLEDYALFKAIKTEQAAFGRRKWQDWPEALRRRNPEALKKASMRLMPSVRFWQFAQWCFARQYEALRQTAHASGIEIIGDLPIFVSPQSADVWSHPELFLLDEFGNPKAVSGVPPDYFSPTGQLWGNPLYNWPAHEKEGYAWWTARLSRAADLYDIVRIDHFRGFDAYWSVPARARTALHGHWEKGPGKEPFERVMKARPALRFIAEDLGIITPSVRALRRTLGLPGMRVLQFAFSGQMDNPHLPGSVPENAAYYPGTHDNNTILGWYEALDERARQSVDAVLVGDDPIHVKALRAVYASRARYAVALAQDALGLDASARMNRPGDATGSWGWRLKSGMLTDEAARKLADLSAQYARNQ